jgi:hypothetical protein
MVTVAGVSLPLASGAVAWATVSVIRSPTTTTRVNVVTTLIKKTEPGPSRGGGSVSPDQGYQIAI